MKLTFKVSEPVAIRKALDNCKVTIDVNLKKLKKKDLELLADRVVKGRVLRLNNRDMVETDDNTIVALMRAIREEKPPLAVINLEHIPESP